MRILKRCAALVILLLPAVATAGSSAAGKPILPAAVIAVFADRVQNDLAARGASVAIVSRMGRDPAGAAMIVPLLCTLSGIDATGYMMGMDAYFG